VLSSVGYGVPAAALTDRTLAAWVRAHGVTVTADDDDELDLVQHSGIRPTQVVFRCGPATDCIRRAVHLGVFRFIVGTPLQIARLREFAQRTEYLYIDEDSPLVLADRRLKVIGLHGDVDASGGPAEWASVADRLLCRAALLKSCGSPIKRIMLSGGSTEAWSNALAPQLTSIAGAVDDALREGCERWRLPRPAVTFVPSSVSKLTMAA
jgi:diaminopimelate decarboxylase